MSIIRQGITKAVPRFIGQMQVEEGLRALLPQDILKKMADPYAWANCPFGKEAVRNRSFQPKGLWSAGAYGQAGKWCQNEALLTAMFLYPVSINCRRFHAADAHSWCNV
jgi:hypothetical protein